MNDWQKDWWQQFEKTTVNIEKFFHNVNEVMESVTEDVTDTLEELGEQFQDALTSDIDRCIEDLIDFMTDVNLEVERHIWEDIENFVSDEDFVDIATEIPTEDSYSACIGCKHYHGQKYNGQILVCGMHPYGFESDRCPDWES